MESLPHLYPNKADRWCLSAAVFCFGSEGECRVGRWEAGLNGVCVHFTFFFAFLVTFNNVLPLHRRVYIICRMPRMTSTSIKA